MRNKFAAGNLVRIKLPWYERLMPEWKQKEYRIGDMGEVVNVTPKGKIAVAQCVVRFADGEEKEYPEPYLESI